MTTTIDGTDVSTFAAGVTCTALNGGQLGGRRNIVINGAMLLQQVDAQWHKWLMVLLGLLIVLN